MYLGMFARKAEPKEALDYRKMLCRDVEVLGVGGAVSSWGPVRSVSSLGSGTAPEPHLQKPGTETAHFGLV